jgi:hypothetical protein
MPNAIVGFQPTPSHAHDTKYLSGNRLLLNIDLDYKHRPVFLDAYKEEQIRYADTTIRQLRDKWLVLTFCIIVVD